MNTFIHLRTHSAYSFKYGTTQPRDLVARASEYQMPALALTDRDGLAGAIRFAQSCVDYGVAPIIGINLAIDVESTPFTKEVKNLPRITLLAHGDGGWSSLCRLVSSLHTYQPSHQRFDKSIHQSGVLQRSTTPILTLDFLNRFSQYSTNLLALHGPESPVGIALARQRPDIAQASFAQLREYFSSSAIECVSHLIAGNGPRSSTHAGRSLVAPLPTY